jgi:hypothetical protein
MAMVPRECGDQPDACGATDSIALRRVASASSVSLYVTYYL